VRTEDLLDHQHHRLGAQHVQRGLVLCLALGLAATEDGGDDDPAASAGGPDVGHARQDHVVKMR
jgi:hypothetical protein